MRAAGQLQRGPTPNFPSLMSSHIPPWKLALTLLLLLQGSLLLRFDTEKQAWASQQQQDASSRRRRAFIGGTLTRGLSRCGQQTDGGGRGP